MVDLPFWQQLVLAALQGLLPAALVAAIGWRYFRLQEQARNQEASRTELARLQRDLILGAAAALGELMDARFETIFMDDSSAETAAKTAVEVQRASRHFFSVLVKNQLLLPEAAADALLEAYAAFRDSQDQDDLDAAANVLNAKLAPILHDLTQGPLPMMTATQSAPANPDGTSAGP